VDRLTFGSRLFPPKFSAWSSELERVLRKKGRLPLTMPNYQGLWVVIDLLTRTVYLVPGMMGGAHTLKYHRHTLAAPLGRAGIRHRAERNYESYPCQFIAFFSER
jgi:hypothetical protein